VSVEEFATVARRATARIEVKRSVFLATAAPVSDEEGARTLVAELRREHHDARHHCSAYVLGPAGGTERAHDDGEPAGTAGAPMLEVLRGAGLTDTVVVVTRWFGGTLLGAGGLVRAYGDAVREVLPVAGVRTRRRLDVLEVLLDPAEAGRVESGLRTRGVEVGPVTWADRVRLEVLVPGAEVASLEAWLAATTSGRASPRHLGHRWT